MGKIIRLTESKLVDIINKTLIEFNINNLYEQDTNYGELKSKRYIDERRKKTFGETEFKISNLKNDEKGTGGYIDLVLPNGYTKKPYYFDCNTQSIKNNSVGCNSEGCSSLYLSNEVTGKLSSKFCHYL